MSAPTARILLVDSEPAVHTLLDYPLRKDGYQVTAVRDGREALDCFAKSRFDLVILDLALPRVGGIEVCRRLRRLSRVPILMLTDKDSEADLLAGLDVGADDCIAKPFSIREFRSRIKAALRRSWMPAKPIDEKPMAFGRLRIDPSRRKVTVAGEDPELTFVEFELLTTMARALGRPISREILLECVWGNSEYRDPRSVDVHIRHLREKLERNPKKPEYVITVRGVGYRFME